MISGATAVNTRVHLATTNSHTRLRVHWAPGIPHALFGAQVLARLGRSAPRELNACVETVIASAAKQSISPRKERMDCFAALAMTILETLLGCQKLNWGGPGHLAKFVICYNQFVEPKIKPATGT